MSKVRTKTKKLNEETLTQIRKDFIKTIPQLQEIQEAQEVHRELREKEAEHQYPFIDTQSFSTL